MVTPIAQPEVFLVGFTKAFSNTLIAHVQALKPDTILRCFPGGDEALDALHARAYQNQPSLIFMDASLIDTFLWKMKAHRLTRQVPALILTGSLSNKALARGYKLGANSILQLHGSSRQIRHTLDITLTYWFDFCKLAQGITPWMTGS